MGVHERVLPREVVLTVGAALVQLGIPLLASLHSADPNRSLPAAGVVLLVLAVTAIPLRLRHPVGALGLAFGTTIAYVTLDYARGPVFVALIVTFGNAVLRGHRTAAIAALLGGYVGSLWLGPAFGRSDAPGLVGALALAAWLLVLYTACELLRARQERARESARAREDTLRRQIANERLAIARELHDVVAHNMSLINLQAGVALHIDENLSDPGRAALETIKAASKEALVELRSILGVLRHADDDQEAPRGPVPGLRALDELVRRAESAGVRVTVHVDADLPDVPRQVDLAAYRIIQESLTNVARHADPPVATVQVRRDGGTLVVSVIDTGTGRRRTDALPSGGNGLPGMRERASSVGGVLVAGPRLGAGFAVEARLPLRLDGEDGSA